ncbi:MAG: sugar kinase [Deltaproteobacteria bacterium]|nr:sugar kinase [Deltaproteobacteria bacterium]
MLAVVGTVPDDEFPFVEGEAHLEGDRVLVGGHAILVNRGTPALLAAAIKAGEVLNGPRPFACLVGDTGQGHGSRRLYERLVRDGRTLRNRVVVFHYLQPDVDWHNKVLFAVEETTPRPTLIADAGFMYAAKMSGQSEAYELFTPDAGELAFLADEEAPHPFYTRGFILHEENRIPDLIDRAYVHKNAARCLLVKGNLDHVATRNGIHAVIDHPANEALEAMGGTGDSLTGVVAALIASGTETLEAAVLAARVNRLAGHLADPTPASQVMEVIEQIPAAMAEMLEREKESHGSRRRG